MDDPNQQPQIQHANAEVTPEQVALAAMQASRTNLELSPRHLDDSYVREIHYFEDWVFTMRAQNKLPMNGVRLTRENVDLYFTSVVVERRLNHNSTRRVENALQWLVDDFI